MRLVNKLKEWMRAKLAEPYSKESQAQLNAFGFEEEALRRVKRIADLRDAVYSDVTRFAKKKLSEIARSDADPPAEGLNTRPLRGRKA